MDKFQEQIKRMGDEELIKMADAKGDKLLSFCLWVGIIAIPIGLLCASFMGDTAMLFTISGVLLVLMCFPLVRLSKKNTQVAVEEVVRRGIEYKVEAKKRQAAQERAENKAFGTSLLIVFILVALIIFGIRGCMGMGTVSCPKCGSTYSTDHAAGRYISSHGVCARCERDG